MRKVVAFVFGVALVSSLLFPTAGFALAHGVADRLGTEAEAKKGNEVESLVTGVTGTNISVQTKAGTSVVVVTDASTVFTKEKQPASYSDINVGDKVEAKGTNNPDGTFAATSVQIKLPKIEGQVTGVTGNDITVQTKDGTKTVRTSGSTTFTQKKQPASLGEVTVGARVKAKGVLNPDSSLSASTVDIKGNGVKK